MYIEIIFSLKWNIHQTVCTCLETNSRSSLLTALYKYKYQSMICASTMFQNHTNLELLEFQIFNENNLSCMVILTMHNNVHLLTVISTRIACCAGILPCHVLIDVVQWPYPSILHRHIWFIHPGNTWCWETKPIANKSHILTFFGNNAVPCNSHWRRNYESKRQCLFFTAQLCHCTKKYNTCRSIWMATIGHEERKL